LPIIALSTLLQAQEKPPEKCSLSGTVVNSITGEPLSKVDLALEPVNGRTHVASVTVTDSEGRFAMIDLEPGSYHLTGKRNGYLDTAYGARRPEGTGTVLRLDAGQPLPDLSLKLVPFGVISGVIRDSDGEPLNDARVTAARLSYESGKPRLEGYDSTVTDDLGQYRFRGLKPGKYYIAARLDPDHQIRVDHSKTKAAAEGPVPTVYPGSSDPSLAAPIELAMGARVNGIDITIARARTFTVSGRVVTAAGSGATGAFIGVRGRVRGFDFDSALTTTTRNANGDFEIRGVQAGHYNLSATRGGAEVTVVPLDVTGNVEGVRVVLGQGAQVRAGIRMEGGDAVRPQFWQIVITRDGRNGGYSLEPNDLVAAQNNVSPGHYEVRVERLAENTYVKSIRSGDNDVLNDGLTISQGANVRFEITLAVDAGKVEGTVTGKDDQPGVGATVVLVPETRFRTRSDLFQSVTTDQYGRFEFNMVPPGEYKVFAWDDVEPGIWNDPAFLKENEKRGEPVTVAANGRETVKVKL